MLHYNVIYSGDSKLYFSQKFFTACNCKCIRDWCSCSNNLWQQVFSYFKGIYYVHMNSNWIRFDWYNSKFHAATMSVIVENNISYICHRNIYNLQYTIFYISMLTTRNWMTVLHGHMLFHTLQKNYINKINIFLKIYNHLHTHSLLGSMAHRKPWPP